MTPTPNPTAEQILTDEWILQADRAKAMTGMDAIWFPDAGETLAALRAHNLLSEGAPSEEQVERNAVIQQMQDELEYRVRTSKARINYDKAFIDDQVQQGRARIGKLAFSAAGVAPQEPQALDPEKVAAVVQEAISEYMQKHSDWNCGELGYPGSMKHFIARALCEAAKRGELS